MHDDLTTLKVGYNSFRRAAASLMFRKDVVVEALGAFDETRKAADTEFGDRIETVFGAEANVNLLDVLVLTQLTEGSLSREEFAFGWHHRSRVAYSQAARHWHREIAAGREHPVLEPGGPAASRLPDRFLTGKDAPPVDCDVMWVSDWRGDLGSLRRIQHGRGGRRDAGLSTMVAQATAVRHSDRDRVPIGDDILRLQADGLTRFAIWTEPAHSRLMIVSDPEILALTRPPETVGAVHRPAGHRRRASAHRPRPATGGRTTPPPSSATPKRMFGVEPAWLPAHERHRR